MTRWRYTCAGALLGLGAPLGSFLLRLALIPELRARPLAELSEHRFFYLYGLVGTCAVLAIVGYLAGLRAERLQNREEYYHELAERDPLTGLFNARAFRQRYDRALERVAGRGDQVALLLVDVDLLKKINDIHGHRVGDAALCHVADALRQSARATDEVARWGGDEFAVLLEGSDAAAAGRVSEGLLERLHQAPLILAGGGQLPVTVTIGAAASASGHGRDLFGLADQALYEGKRSGRDRFLHSRPEKVRNTEGGRK